MRGQYNLHMYLRVSALYDRVLVYHSSKGMLLYYKPFSLKLSYMFCHFSQKEAITFSLELNFKTGNLQISPKI